MSPQHYNDGQADPQDATDERSVSFDWEGLRHAMGEDDLGPVEYQRLAFALGRVLRWIVQPHAGKAGSRNILRLIGLRVLMLTWVADPRMFDGSPSLRSLAKRYGFSHRCLSHHARQASERLGIQNRPQIARRSTDNVPKGPLV